MIRNIVTMELLLSRPSAPATSEDASVATDLLDTLAAHRDRCVGLAANMIGVRKRVIAFTDGARDRAMFNPKIVKSAGPYDTTEACLSLKGERPTRRFKRITVRYQDANMAVHTEQFEGFTAEIIQHEIDHCNGVII